MINLQYARDAFDRYLQDFDRENEKILLKIIHTENVASCAREIAFRMKLSEEDCQLAELIALLHDIGRFEQIRLFDSFEPTTMDHAGFGVELLFGERQMIRQFAEEDTWDEIIRTAIGRHSDFSVGKIEDPRTLLHARLIRDADKLDNCRVKLEESIEVMLGVDEKTVGQQRITDRIWEACLRHESILSAERVTKMDYWVSYVAYFFDINFAETFSIIKEENYVHRIIDRIPYSDRETAEKMDQLGKMVESHMESVMSEKEEVL